ncbi:hypothetical protein LKV13_04230 [Borrelia sp. BU AG58]|uniref:hypothetical protein n=1 Tax=Borrelia sp. BU AG58 TaxID=2887345 RepID=UPI001E567122|nr:hypothetical protein [Borrelia sp. BU AG58]UER67966.1 hypothetical protein LKV13_04230 [Borrelia sp. BU AG58]
MNKISFNLSLALFLVSSLTSSYSTDEEQLEKLNKLYMLYDLSNNLAKEFEVINEIKNLNLELYHLLMTKYLLKIKKYEEASLFFEKIKESKNKKITNEVILLKLRLNEDKIGEKEINETLEKYQKIDAKVLYQLYLIARKKIKAVSLKIKNVILTNYPKSIYSYKIKGNE